MYALVGVCYLGRNIQLHICSPGSPLALTTLTPLANLALLGTHVVPHDNVSFTDEAHYDPDQRSHQCVLREEGTKYDANNMQEMSKLQGSKLHMTCSIS